MGVWLPPWSFAILCRYVLTCSPMELQPVYSKIFKVSSMPMVSVRFCFPDIADWYTGLLSPRSDTNLLQYSKPSWTPCRRLASRGQIRRPTSCGNSCSPLLVAFPKAWRRRSVRNRPRDWWTRLGRCSTASLHLDSELPSGQFHW